MIEGTWFIGLLTPNGTEIDGPGYARAPVILRNGRNQNTVEFCASPSGWGQIGYWGLFETDVSVKAVALSAINAHVSAGDTVKIGFDFQIDLNPQPPQKPAPESVIVVDKVEFGMLRDKAQRAWQAIEDVWRECKGTR